MLVVAAHFPGLAGAFYPRIFMSRQACVRDSLVAARGPCVSPATVLMRVFVSYCAARPTWPLVFRAYAIRTTDLSQTAPGPISVHHLCMLTVGCIVVTGAISIAL